MYINKTRVRLGEVTDRSAENLTQIIQKCVKESSATVTDQWVRYNKLREHEYTHYAVNHSENNVNPETVYHTQGIERAWTDAKAYTKFSEEYSHLLQYRLYEISWRNCVSENANFMFEEFWKSVALSYNTYELLD